jgi:pimeloyl-ACP methyl ester carboxylesterase
MIAIGASRAAALVAMAVIVLAGCSANVVPEIEPGPSPTPPTSSSADRHGVVEIGDARVGYWCEGNGGPVTILEAGSDTAGIEAWAGIMESISEVTTVCTYNRLGTGGSSAPPNHSRTGDDLVGALDGVLAALGLEPPYVMAGQFSGGNIAIAYAHTHPDRIAALVPIEAYHDDPAEVAARQTTEGLTWQDNPEHVDVVPWSVAQEAYAFPFGDFPVLVVSVSDADQDGPQNQAHWLEISSNSRQAVIEGPHDLQCAAAEELAAEMVSLVTSLRRE